MMIYRYGGMLLSMLVLLLGLYTAAFSWFVLVWAIPYLLVLWDVDRIPWSDGIMLSLLFFGIGNAGFVWGCLGLTAPLLLYRLYAVGLYCLFSILYGALYGLLLAACVPSSARGSRSLVRLLLLWLFLLGVGYGNPLLCPLIPLVEYPTMLTGMRLFGMHCMLLVTLLMQLLVVACLRIRSWVLYGTMVGIAFLVYGAAFWCPSRWIHKAVKPSDIASLVLVSSSCSRMGEPCRTARHLIGHCYYAARHAAATCILAPESSLYDPWLFQSWDHAAQGAAALLTGLTVVVGGFCAIPSERHPRGAYNSAWFLGDGRVIDHYDKKRPLVLTESLPDWIMGMPSLCWLYDLFFTERHYICAGKAVQRPVWQLYPGLIVVPYICSEVLCSNYPDDSHSDLPILALCNSAWLPPLLQWVMMRTVRFRAYQWERSIIYSAQTYASMCDYAGNMVILPCEISVCNT